MGRRLRPRVMVGLLGCFVPCAAQTGLPDPAIYESFFLQVARLAGVSEPTPIALTRPTPKERLRLTDQEAQVLNELATEYASERGLIDDAVKRLTFEKRLWIISSQEVPAPLTRKLKGLEDRRTELVADRVQRLESALGAARFQALNDYVLSREKDRDFFPAPVDPSRPVPKKARAVKK